MYRASALRPRGWPHLFKRLPEAKRAVADRELRSACEPAPFTKANVCSSVGASPSLYFPTHSIAVEKASLQAPNTSRGDKVADQPRRSLIIDKRNPGNRDIFQQKQGDNCGKTDNYHVGLGI
jgi:hypothetical protein